MQKNIILAGVGGQGILSIAYVFDNAALDAGFHFKQAEVHGMAQRGGAVQSNLRYSDAEIHSDLIPEGKCDMVLAVEPLEVMRYWHYLKPDGWVVTSITPYVNIPDYPEMDTLLSDLAAFPNMVMVDTGHLARAAGNLRAQNTVVVGAASNLLDFTEQQLLKHVEGLFAHKGEKIVEVNRKAFLYGRAAGAFFRALVDGGLDAVKAVKLCSKIKPETMSIDLASGWIERLGNDTAILDTIQERGSDVSA
jgi:indolepyruvate ferredoxin oxidoreductase beta subunit